MEATHVSIDGWIDKQNVVNTYNGILFSLLKEGKSDTRYNMDEPCEHYAKRNKTLIQKDTFTPMFIETLHTTGKVWKQPKYPSTDKWVKKMLYIYIYIYIYTHTHTHNGILVSYNKGWNFAICSNVDGLGGYYAKWTKSYRERQGHISIYKHLKNNRNECICKTETESQIQETNLWLPKGGGKWGGKLGVMD